MRLSASEVDWSKLSQRARWALDEVMPRLVEGDSLAEIAVALGVSRDEVAEAHELLEAETQALAGRIMLPEITPDEYEALKESIGAHGQIYPILYGSDGVLVDGRNRLKACRELQIDPKTRTLELPSDQLQSLALAVNVARRHLTAGARRGIAKAALLSDASRSDREIAAAAGVAPNTVKAVRAELESTAQIAQSTTRVGADGKTRALPAREPRPEPTHRTICVAVAADQFDELVDRWVACSSFRIAETRPNVYELQVQLIDAEPAGHDLLQKLASDTAALDVLLDAAPGTGLAQLLADATEIFGHPITDTTALNETEAQWCLNRLAELATMLTPATA